MTTTIESRDPILSEIHTNLRLCIVFHYKNFLCAVLHLILFLSIKSSTKASRKIFFCKFVLYKIMFCLLIVRRIFHGSQSQAQIRLNNVKINYDEDQCNRICRTSWSEFGQVYSWRDVWYAGFTFYKWGFHGVQLKYFACKRHTVKNTWSAYKRMKQT